MLFRSFLALMVLVLTPMLLRAEPADADPEEICAKIGTDDHVRPYVASLRPGFVRAFARLFPKAKGVPSDALLRAEGVMRCMDGRLLACFTGANLPCAKLNAERGNPGADAFCGGSRDAAEVPMVATGHDTAFTYRCKDGHAEVSGETFELDARGFAASLWAPLD